MGICASSKHVEQEEEEEEDENVVYVVVDEQGDGGGGEGTAMAASLFSQKGKKGPNQDVVILCQVRAPPVYSFALDLSFAMPRFTSSIISDHYFWSKKEDGFLSFLLWIALFS